MYTTTWCGYCIRLKSQLHTAGIGYRGIDVETHRQAAHTVQRINGGSQTVPTLVLPSGLTLVNPSLNKILRKSRTRVLFI